MLKGKTVLLGVTGSIAAYKIAGVASRLVKLHCDVHVIMTKNATNFITPITFETLTGNKCLVDTFDRNFQFSVAHVSLAQKADVILIAPATANSIAKFAYGIADDMLTTTVLAASCKKIISPAMNTHMLHNPAVQKNLEKIKEYGFEVIPSAHGMLACREEGDGKMPEEQVLIAYILKEIAFAKDLQGRKVMVSAGPTQESIDPVRYITNHSSGKMGYELARAAMLRGADVTLISGCTALEKPPFMKIIDICSAQEMFQAVKESFQNQDIIIKAAAVADYRPKTVYEDKVKKTQSDMCIELERTTDILGYLGENRTKEQFLCGFSMETRNMVEYARAKLKKKKIDMIIANNLKVQGAGFQGDTNVVTIITPQKETQLERMSKEAVAHTVLNHILFAMQDEKQTGY